MKRKKNNPILDEAKAETRMLATPDQEIMPLRKVTISLESLDLVSYGAMRVETKCF